MELNADVLLDSLTEALLGHRCVSAWLGYGKALFLGFGSEIVPERDSEGRRTMPPYELQTGMANWRVAGLLSSEDERKDIERIITNLVGRPVFRWRLRDNRSLEIELIGGWLVEIIPSAEVDPEWSDSDEWWFCLPGARYAGIGGGGRVVVGRTDRPGGGPGAAEN